MEIVEIRIESVSRDIYQIEGVVLSSTDTTRTIFAPLITPKGVDGTIIYEKKNANGEWVSTTGISKTNVRKGEWTKIRLSTSEIAELVNYVTSLDEFKDSGLLDAFHHYLIAGLFNGFSDEEIDKIKAIVGKNPAILRKLIEINERSGEANLDNVLAALNSNYEIVSDLIQRIDFASANNIRLATKIKLLNIDGLETLITNDSSEEDFQNFFLANPEILSIAIPCLIHCIQDKPYCGGKDISGSGGTVGDFLYKERNNLAFVEIKTPSCKLVESDDYRNGLRKLSADICNAVVQVKHEKDVFYKMMAGDSKYRDSFLDCKCYVIAGLSSSLSDQNAVNSFELFKASLSNVIIITYDEIVEMVKRITRILTE